MIVPLQTNLFQLIHIFFLKTDDKFINKNLNTQLRPLSIWKVDDVNNTSEEDSEFVKKCKDLRQYLEQFNANYKHCFNGEAADLFLYSKNLMNKALIRCTNYEKRQALLERDKEGQMIAANDLGELQAEDKDSAEDEDSTKVTLPVEKKNEPGYTGNDATRKSKEFEDQKQQCVDGTHSSVSESIIQQVTSGSSQILSLSNDSLSPNNGQPGSEAQSSGSLSPEDSLNDVSTLETPETNGTVPQGDNSLRSVPIMDSKSNNPSDVSGLGKGNNLNTQVNDNSDLISEPHKFPSAPEITVAEPLVDQVDQTDRTPQDGATGSLSTETSAKEISRGLSTHSEGTSPISAASPARELAPTGSVLSAEGESPTGISPIIGMLSHSYKSVSIVTLLSGELSLHVKRVASAAHQLSDEIMSPIFQYPLASQIASPVQHLSQSQLSNAEEIAPQKQTSAKMEHPAQALPLQEGCKHHKTTCSEHIRTYQSDVQNLNMHNYNSGEQNSLHNIGFSSKGEFPSEPYSVQGDAKSHTSNTESQEIPIKTYIIIILVILAIILFTILLFKYACLRGYFSKKKKKKRQRIQEELDRIMYSPSIFDEKNMYLPYSRLENSYNDIEYEI
ncbi:PIR Superfamily Protein [Plasmodium ovale wallikeri]|uniref:PIR Superfamily Protein n=1 Tax=Plasmodium ovale wallikeri TaxID=864142 RepID=A0A1A8YZP6_PLAOA|nr:PIR Superfamily Protein [Plasmodium ovale wallikeri]SBT37184.1 PIR Superfamily Protein [Plasmodium ovale wallikeri]